jgi:endonuclease/exonuclease/phosphatase family metal-dependent hydrolase
MPALRVATFNVKHGQNGDGRVDLRRLAAASASLSADVLAIQEVDRFARRTGFRDEMRIIARATGLQAVFGEAARKRWRSYGNVLLARVSVNGVALSVGATHLSFRKGEGVAQLDVLLAALAERDGPRLLLGDLNIGPDLVVPAVTAAGYTVAPTEATFPACAPRSRIDFVAVSGLDIVSASTPEVGTSDHLPIVADLAVP